MRLQFCLLSIMVAAFLVISPGFAADGIDLAALTQETQKMSSAPDELTIVWWIPEEFWAASLADVPSTAETRRILELIRSYTMVAVVDGTMGPLGGVTYRDETFIRSNTRIIDASGKSYSPRTQKEIDADTRNLLQMIKPIIENMLGPMGQNMHFLLFPATSAAGKPIVIATEPGQLTVRIAEKSFKWRLPLDSLLPTMVCSSCGEECKGSWNYCPWCGKKLERTSREGD